MAKQEKLLVVADPQSLTGDSSSIDWSRCCICQSKNKENLVCPARNKNRSKLLSGYNTLADNLCAFKEIGELDSIKHFDMINEGLGIAATLSSREAKWHKNCAMQYNSTKLQRAHNKYEATKAQNIESSRLTRSSMPVPPTDKIEIPICFICSMPETRNNKLQLVTSLQLNERVKEWAQYLMDARLIGMLEIKDLVASNAKYHKKCLQNLRNKCRKDSLSADSKSTACEAVAYAELVAYMEDELESEDRDVVFQMSTLTTMYRIRLAQLLGIPECKLPETRSTSLREKLQDEFPQLTVHRPSKEYQLVCKSADLSLHANSHDLHQDAIGFSRFSVALRKEMKNWKTCFRGTFDKNCQESSVPPLLLASLNMIIYGTWYPEECKATEPALAIAQLVMFNYKSKAPSGNIVRHDRDHEPPLPLYSALEVYGRTRSKTVIDDLHKRGLSVSNNRVREVTSALCHLNINRAEEEGLLCPSNLLQGVFTIGAYDNVDHNPSSNTSEGSFHGTSISVFQTPSDAQPGHHRSFQSTYNSCGLQTLDVPQLPESFAIVPNAFLVQTKPKIPGSCCPVLSQMLPTETMEWKTESEWLEHVLNCSNHEDGTGSWSWAAYHAINCGQNNQNLRTAVCSLLPLFFEQSNTVSIVCHGMNIIINTTHHLNPLQTPVMYGDQPLYTIGKLIQWNWPDLYGQEKFVLMFAPFHIEKAFLGVIGQYMEGCGWISVAVNAGLATQGTAEAIMKVSHVKKSRTAHEITAAALYMLINQAHSANSPNVAFESWVREQASELPTFKFWLNLLNLEILLLSFVRSLREGNYNLYRECLKQMLPWFFLFDHQNYARWLSVHVADLELLPTSAPDVYAEFMKGNFVIRKSQRPFSALAVDQAHEQHNAIVKGDGGAIGLTQDPAALRRWMLAGPEICRLLQEFKDVKSSHELHHEQYPAFQNKFLRQVRAVEASIQEFGNPFQEQEKDLIVLDTRTIADTDIVNTLNNLEKNGNELYREFVEQRLVKKTSSLFEPIKKQKTRIFANVKKPKTSKQMETVKDLKTDVNLFSKLFISCQNRSLDLDMFFSYENQINPPSLSSMGNLRMCQKSDIVTVLKKEIEGNAYPENCNSHIFDGAALVHSHPPRSSKTFKEYCCNEFRRCIVESTENIEARRIDIVWDLYSDISLKKQVRDDRGQGIRRQVHENYKLPSNWPIFLKNSQNKEELFKLLGCYALQGNLGIHIVTNIGPTIKSSVPTKTLLTGLNVTCEEADSRIILHAKDMAMNGATNIIIHTVDSDVVIIAISYYFSLERLGLKELWVSFGTGKHHSYIAAHDLAHHLGEEKAEAMRGYHAFTGCDTVSAFYSKGKTLTWKAWQQCIDATSAFKALSNPLNDLTDDILISLEKYVIKLYRVDSEIVSVNEARKFLFTKNKALQNIPPTRDALKMHTLRAAYQAGYIWGQAFDSSPDIPSPSNWGWTEKEGQWQPIWTTQHSIWDAARELVKCGCKNSCRGRCSCRREGMPCTLLCKTCNGNCDNSSVMDREALIEDDIELDPEVLED